MARGYKRGDWCGRVGFTLLHRQLVERQSKARLEPPLHEAGLVAPYPALARQEVVGEIGERGHVGVDDQKEDVERARYLQAELDVLAGDELALESLDLVERVALELDVDDGRERMADRLLGDQGHVGGDRSARPQAAKPARDRG